MKKSDVKIHVMKNFGFLLFLGISISSSAQNEIDALRYSQTTFGGTAKFMAMAGAWGALGGEMSTLSINPGGIGIYRKSEVLVTPNIFSQNATSIYNGSTNSDNKLNLNLENIGFIFSNNWGNESKGSGWMTLNFGFAHNKTNNFNSRVIIDGTNNTNSLLNSFVTNSNGISPTQLEPFSTQLAFATNLIDTIPGTVDYSSAIPAGSVLQQKKTIETSGSMGETVISAGGNYLNKLFLGITVGFSNINYSEQSTYREITPLDSLTFAFHNSLTTKGNGVNFKFGLIYQPVDWLRLGGAVHSATFYTLRDRWNSDITSTFNNLNHGGLTFSSNSPNGIFDYRLTTPLKIIGSVGFHLLKKGLIGFDYEYVDYSSASLNSTPNVFFDANAAIRNKYRATQNLRTGIEWIIAPISLRLGYAYYGNPYKSGINLNASRSSYTAGFGIRENSYFIDFAFVFSQYSENYYLYDPTIINPVKNTFKSSNILITLGKKF